MLAALKATSAEAMERLVELMQESPELANEARSHQPIVLDSKDAIVLRDVAFTYPSRPDFLAMDQVSFVVPQGARYALVGTSGAGKRTLFSLFLRF